MVLSRFTSDSLDPRLVVSSARAGWLVKYHETLTVPSGVRLWIGHPCLLIGRIYGFSQLPFAFIFIYTFINFCFFWTS